jgi:hypothetical protein
VISKKGCIFPLKRSKTFGLTGFFIKRKGFLTTSKKGENFGYHCAKKAFFKRSLKKSFFDVFKTREAESA